jgi:hypothetical protein
MKVADPYLDIKQNPILGELLLLHHINIYINPTNHFIFLGQGFADIARSRYSWVINTDATTASTDFVRSVADVFICVLN